jgi:hypothetical protein
VRYLSAATLLVTLLLSAGCSADSTSSPTQGASPTDVATATDGAAAADPAPTPAQAAASIVTDPEAYLDALAVSPADPARRIASWYVCRDPACRERRYALAVTDDGFESSTVLEVWPRPHGFRIAPAGPDHFSVAVNDGWWEAVVDGSGVVVPIESHPVRAGPLVGDEVPLISPRSNGWLALDPTSGSTHWLSTPRRTTAVLQTPAGQLLAVAMGDRPDYLTSQDGGKTWSGRPIPHVRQGRELVWPLPTAHDGAQAVLVGGDGATLFPWDRVLRTPNGRAWTAYEGPHDPTGYVGFGVVLPDRRLLLGVDAWSDEPLGPVPRPGSRPVGWYAAADWAHLEPVDLGRRMADRLNGGDAPRILAIVVTRGHVTIYATPGIGDVLLSTTDGGLSWRRERAR